MNPIWHMSDSQIRLHRALLKRLEGPLVGIKETKELVVFILKLGQSLQVALADGKLSIMDVVAFLPAFRAFEAAIKDAHKVPAELKDLSPSERSELLSLVKEQFDIPNDELEAKVEMALEVGLALMALVASFRA